MSSLGDEFLPTHIRICTSTAGESEVTSISTNRIKKEPHQNGVENLSRRMLPKSVIKFNNEGDIDAQM
ncbi:hypothetical protein OGZ01_13055 [Vibrio harveyi]|nr:hypothetical protein [Vibrio harveyi]